MQHKIGMVSKNNKNLIDKLENLIIFTLKNIKKFPNILQRLKFYEEVHRNLSTNTIMNKREFYYNSVNIFKSQSVVDRLIKETCCKLKCLKSDLLISTTLKGLYYGSISFYKNGELLPIKSKEISLIPEMANIEKVECFYEKCLIIEKDTIFSKIIREYKNDNILLICGKGYPCFNTLELVDKLKIKKYGLFDFDPYGLEICSKYPLIGRIGITIEDIKFISSENIMELSKCDKTRIESLYKKDIFKTDLVYMLRNNIKVELEGLFNSPGFNLEDYIKDAM